MLLNVWGLYLLNIELEKLKESNHNLEKKLISKHKVPSRPDISKATYEKVLKKKGGEKKMTEEEYWRERFAMEHRQRELAEDEGATMADAILSFIKIVAILEEVIKKNRK